jgi:hypothetical protein
MRNGANATDPCLEVGHLVKWGAFCKSFETAHLSYMEVGFLDLPLIVQVDGDLDRGFKTGLRDQS